MGYTTQPLSKKVPGWIILDIVALVVFCPHAIPTYPSIAGYLRSQHIVTGITVNNSKHF